MFTVTKCDMQGLKNATNKGVFPYGVPNKESKRTVLGRLKEKYVRNLDTKNILFFVSELNLAKKTRKLVLPYDNKEY